MPPLKKISFILSALGDAHQTSRYLTFIEYDFEVIIYGFKRKDYTNTNNHSYHQIADLTNSSIVSRLVAYFSALKLYRRLQDASYVYIFGLDNLFLFYLARFFSLKKNKSKVIYEVPDIQPFQYQPSFFSRVLRFLEKRVVKKVDLLTTTSPEFVTDYYETFLRLKIQSYHLLENKVHSFIDTKTERTPSNFLSFTDQVPKVGSKKKIVIGYFGLIRCPYSLELLLDLVKSSDRFVVIIRGFFLGNTLSYKEKILASADQIYYLGKYVSPHDLSTMYSEIDLSWIVYPYSKEKFGNWKWARTNRYYEAGFYQKPAICLKGTADAKNVLYHKIGMDINLDNIGSTKEKILNLTLEDLDGWKKNISKIPKNHFQVGEEYEELFQKIKLLDQ